MLEVIGIIAGVLTILINIPYIIDTLHDKTKPQRVTWGISVLLNLIFIANQSAVGAHNSLWAVYGATPVILIIFLLSFKHGVGGHSTLDIIMLIGTFLGVIFWILFSSPVTSIIANLAVATFAYIPTFKKAWQRPKTETKIKWLGGVFSTALTAVSVGKLDYVVLLLPVYSCIAQLLLYGILVYRSSVKSSEIIH